MTRFGRIVPMSVFLAYAATSLSFAAWRAFVPASNPHAFMNDRARCGECHLEPIPDRGHSYALINFRKDIFTLCSPCHPRPLSHPVEIAPGRGVAKDLPLDPDGAMTCITCHSPHSASHSSRIHTGRSLGEKVKDAFFPFVPKMYRTRFLRLPTPDGELCDACHARRPMGSRPEMTVIPRDRYAGSGACAACHEREYRQWKRTPHARMIRSPRKDPSALLARFTADSPFPSTEIAYVLGSRNVQRFISRRGEDLVVRTPIWIIRSRKWNTSYWREMDWFRSCAGCHTTGFDPLQARYVEEAISCEACHGPGRAHARSGRGVDIVNPGKLDPVRRAMVCESCHTTGHDITGEFRYPVGFLPGRDLRRYYRGLTPKPGQDDASFKGDGSYSDRHAQYLFWRSRMLIAEGETCDLCKNFRLAAREGAASGSGRMTSVGFCLSCHDGTVVPPPPHHGGPGTRGRSCLSCHPPARNSSGGVSIHDHRYIPREALQKNDFIPSPDFHSICFRCHPGPGTKGV